PLLAITPCSLFAGEPIQATEEKEDWFKFTFEARARIEQRNEQGSDNSWAGTFRIRPGFYLGKEQGFAAYVQTESTLAFIDDYSSGPQPQLKPNVANNTKILDPENNELNQLYAQYIGDEGFARIGRQVIIYDNAAFIGNVGWRQNEQTFDAAHVNYEISSLKFKYAYMNRANRIFGTDAVAGAKSLQGNTHIINASYGFGEHSVTGYSYLMDFDEQNFNAKNTANNNTYGLFTDLTTSFGDFHIEGAYQTEAGDKADYDATYAHLIYTKNLGKFKGILGTEYLGQGFITPLATVHAFNGFADVFINERLGLSGGEGLTDFYTGISSKFSDVTFKTNIHAFFDDSVSSFYGWEIDALAIKPITEDIKAIAKFAQYFGDDASAYNNDVTQFSVELNYTF
ncbi:MAG: hypothetical protein ACI9FG_001891, partial [Crocinitomicaceae bacterium]